MLSAGMPELQHEFEIQNLVKKLDFEKSDQEAAKNFRKEIHRAVHTTFRRIDNLAHNFV